MPNDDGTFTCLLRWVDTGEECRIDRLTDIEAFNLADELENAGNAWDQVIERWSCGYRNDNPFH